MRNSKYHSKYKSKALVRKTHDQPFMPLIPKKIFTREITSLSGCSSHEELNHQGTFWPNLTTATPSVGRLARSCLLKGGVSRHPDVIDQWTFAHWKINGYSFFDSILFLVSSSRDTFVNESRWFFFGGGERRIARWRITVLTQCFNSRNGQQIYSPLYLL